jgi:gliding motility-associated-like protein
MRPAGATHLVGGELTYRFVDAKGPATAPFRYEIRALVYFNKEQGSTAPDGSPNIPIIIYSKAAGGARLLTLNVLRSSFSEITPTNQPGCSQTVPRVTLAIYQTTVNLPAVPEGYKAVFTTRARNEGITNLSSSLSESMTLTVDMTPGTLPNSSPAFSDRALVFVCLGDTSFVLNNAYDSDGDRLSYRLATPYGADVNFPVNYRTGYSAAAPFGSGGFAAVDARTGLARYLSRTQGTFLLAVDVQEFRTVNGQETLLGTLRRDIQIVVRACPGGPNNAPVFAAASLAQPDTQVEEGQTLAFDITATDADAHVLRMTVSSVLLDGAGPVEATVNGQPGAGLNATGVGSVSVANVGTATGTFRLRANCGLARATPYDVVVTVADDVCGSKTIAAVFRVTVTRRPFAARVQGDSSVCPRSASTYRVVGPAFGTYLWTVRGGRLLGPATGTTAQVQWGSGGPGRVTVRGISPSGCPTDSVSRSVAVRPAPPIAGPATYCRKASTGLSYTIAGTPAAYQWTLSGGTIVSGQGSSTVLVDIFPGSTAVLQATNAALAPCTSLFSISQDSTCLYFYNVMTPNRDGKNDVFTIENIERYPNTALTIFNRWGRQVYRSADYRNTFSGENTGPGVYYYLCQLADGSTYKGWFELLR